MLACELSTLGRNGRLSWKRGHHDVKAEARIYKINDKQRISEKMPGLSF
jgi:hypothetical protein